MELDLLGIISTKSCQAKADTAEQRKYSLSVPLDETFRVLLEDYRLEALDGTRFTRKISQGKLILTLLITRVELGTGSRRFSVSIVSSTTTLLNCEQLRQL